MMMMMMTILENIESNPLKDKVGINKAKIEFHSNSFIFYFFFDFSWKLRQISSHSQLMVMMIN
jgi:hypothetical protein